MKRIKLRLFGSMLALLVLIVFVTRAQPEDADLRAFLLPPDGCAMPCWAGIQPGVTTAEEAMAILRAHPWVRPEMVFETPAQIVWAWDHQNPNAAKYLSLNNRSYIAIRNGTVRYIRIMTTIPYGDVHMLLGAPDSGVFSVLYPNSTNSNYLHSAGYFGGSVVYDSDISCPVTPFQFWNAPVRITYSDGNYQTLSSMPDYNLMPGLYRKSCTT